MRSRHFNLVALGKLIARTKRILGLAFLNYVFARSKSEWPLQCFFVELIYRHRHFVVESHDSLYSTHKHLHTISYLQSDTKPRVHIWRNPRNYASTSKAQCRKKKLFKTTPLKKQLFSQFISNILLELFFWISFATFNITSQKLVKI